MRGHRGHTRLQDVTRHRDESRHYGRDDGVSFSGAIGKNADEVGDGCGDNSGTRAQKVLASVAGFEQFRCDFGGGFALGRRQRSVVFLRQHDEDEEGC